MRITLPSGCPAELAHPDADGGSAPTRGLVLLPDIGGLRPLFDEHCARLAGETGRVVCAPEPFPGLDLPPDVALRMAAMAGLDDRAVLGNALAAADATGCESVSIIGFCMGGMYTFKAAATGRFERAVAFYGMIRVPDTWRGPGQGEPLDALRRPHCPVLAVIGGRDVWTPPADVAALRAAPGVTVIEYADGEHGFAHDASRDTHRPADAADAWGRAGAFLAGDAATTPAS